MGQDLVKDVMTMKACGCANPQSALVELCRTSTSTLTDPEMVRLLRA